MLTSSLLQKLRMQYVPTLPDALKDIKNLVAKPLLGRNYHQDPAILPHFPKTAKNPFIEFVQASQVEHRVKRVGVFFSGGQASGGHNVIVGLHEALTKLHPNSILIGFLDGPQGLLDNKHISITADLLKTFRNQGGFDLIGSGRVKLDTHEKFQAAESTCRALNLDGLVVIGGDDSNTNAAFLAEYFLQRGCRTVVVGVPKTIDGDLRNEDIEIPFGFDTATKTYSATIGSIMRDTLSAKKSYYFIKLMGRSASHITLECALKNHPNHVLIGEEIAEQGRTLSQITQQICDLIASRAAAGKEYGVILIPEGVIEFIPEVNQLIFELNALLTPEKPHLQKLEDLSTKLDKVNYIKTLLTDESGKCYQTLPPEFQVQLLLDRDPHGNVYVSKIETERLLIDAVKRELSKRKKAGIFTAKFNAQPLFLGYEGRSCPPSNFDAQYCYTLGHVAALLINASLTGYICCVNHLSKAASEWQVFGRPLISMMGFEKRFGKDQPVIKKALVDLKGKPFLEYKAQIGRWSINDDYCNTGPIQYFGPPALTDSVPLTISL